MNRITFVLSLLFACHTALAADEVFSTPEGAIRGYDPVAYHRDNTAKLGSSRYSYQWNGAEWRFSSAENRDLFAAEPERYAPAYGGYCAFGTSRGYKVGTQPEAFAIVDGKLYLNYNLEVQQTWNQDRPGYIRRANGEWVKIEHEAYVRPD